MKIVFENEQLTVDFKEYRNGNLAILLDDEQGLPFANLSTDTEVVLKENEFVVNHELFPVFKGKLLTCLSESDIFEDTGSVANYGYCRNVPIWRRKAGE